MKMVLIHLSPHVLPDEDHALMRTVPLQIQPFPLFRAFSIHHMIPLAPPPLRKRLFLADQFHLPKSEKVLSLQYQKSFALMDPQKVIHGRGRLPDGPHPCMRIVKAMLLSTKNLNLNLSHLIRRRRLR
jgi:hypothetical protein